MADKKTSKTKSSKDPVQDVIHAAFEMASDTKWCTLSFDDIVRRADVEPCDIAHEVTSKSDILAAYSRRIDQQIIENIGQADPAVPAKDRLFDVLMERYELMNEYRQPLIRIIKSLDPEPTEITANLLQFKSSIKILIEAAGLSTSGLRGTLRQKGVAGIALLALYTWMQDDSPDLSATMVKLDKLLKRAEQFANTFRLHGEDVEN